MLIASLCTAAAAAKWLMAAKIMTTVGAGMLTVAPVVEKMKTQKKER